MGEGERERVSVREIQVKHLSTVCKFFSLRQSAVVVVVKMDTILARVKVR